MEKTLGDKSLFAVQIDILEFEPDIVGKTAIWLNGELFGDYNDQNILGTFFRSLWRISMRPEKLWDDEFNNLNCEEIFYKVNHFYNNPDDFYDLSYEGQGEYVKFDKYIIQWGENFDSCLIKVVVKEDNCKFVYVGTSFNANDSYEVRNNIKCLDVPLDSIQKIYGEMCDLVPDQYWYTSIDKYEG